MAIYDVHTFLTDCFIPNQVQLAEGILLTPLRGKGSHDLGILMNDFGVTFLKQTPMPNEVLESQSNHCVKHGSTVVVSSLNIEAHSRKEAIESTRDTVIVVRETLALRQYTRGTIAGFYVVQTDRNPPENYVESRTQSIRRVYQLGPGDERLILGALVSESMAKNGLLRQYISLFADAISSGDALLTTMTQETRLMKMWTLLETMAVKFSGHKIERVSSLYDDFQIAVRRDYRGVSGKNHLEIAYALRNVVVHSGGCDVASNSTDVDVCKAYASMLPSLVSDLTSDISFMIYLYAARLQAARLPDSGSADPVSLGDTFSVTVGGPGGHSQVEIVPGTSARLSSSDEEL